MQNQHHDVDVPDGMRNMLRDTPRLLWVLLLLALLLPATVTGWFAWHRHTAILSEVQLMAQRSVIALEEHAGNVLQTHALLLRQIADRTQGRPWQQIESDILLHQTFAELTTEFRQVSVIGIADADGRLRASSVRQPIEDVMVVDRDYFIAHRDGTARGIFFSQPYTGRLNGIRQFTISIARTSPSGEFDGIVFAAVSLDYFASFWKQFVPSGDYLIPLMRDDGTVLVRYPKPDNPGLLDPDGPFRSHVRQAPRGLYTAVSQVDGIERINAYSRVKNYPLYISFSVETSAALQNWRDEMLPVLIMAIMATAALVALSLLVIRQSYLQRLTAARWRTIAYNLESEIKRRETAEDQLRQAQKMEAIGQLTGGIAHDFNNMLASIAGNLELGRIHLVNGDTSAVADCVDRAEAVTDRAAAMIQRLLSFARRKTLKAVPVAINDLLQSTTSLLEGAVGPRIRIETVLPATSPIALCDPAQLESALLNLVINARDAMPDGGTITICAATESTANADRSDGESASPSPRIILTVTDTGTGMPQHVADRAFEPFFTTKGVGEGSGLGLSMVIGFAQQSGGNATIQSTLNIGTTVTLILPASKDVMPQDTPDAGKPALADSRTLSGIVLLVEDDAAVRHVLTETLRQAGATVLPADSAEQALNTIAATPRIDLVVTDIVLSGSLSGYQLADAARHTRPELPFLFISGYSKDIDGAESSVLAGDRLMSKPFKSGAFLETVAGMLRSRAPEME